MNAPRIVAWVAVVIASVEALNGAAMIATPMRWFETTPGVTETGPFNEHLVIDVGLSTSSRLRVSPRGNHDVFCGNEAA